MAQQNAGGGPSGYENLRLNDMIDLVENSHPEDLEHAGTALKQACEAIGAAATELGKHIDNVDWEGEAGTAFRKWGRKLVENSHKLAEFAEVAGTHMTTAATGLASVRSSMPPRDMRPDPKTVDEVPLMLQVEGNPEYEAARAGEQNRQEAINQVQRLSSFYRTSQTELVRQEAPVFEPMPDVGVPQPQAGDWEGEGTSGTGATVGPLGSTPTMAQGEQLPAGTPSKTDLLTMQPTRPAGEIGTQIDAVPNPPAPVSSAPPGQPGPLGPLPTAPSGPNLPPFMPGPTLYPGSPPRQVPVAAPPTKSVPSPQGTAKPSPPRGPVGNPAGRPPTSTGPGAGTGRQMPITGRPVNTGQPLRGKAVPGESHGRGIVGGTPQRPPAPRASPVIGGQPPVRGGAVPGRLSQGGIGQGRVVGGGPPGAKPTPARGLARNADAVTAKPVENQKKPSGSGAIPTQKPVNPVNAEASGRGRRRRRKKAAEDPPPSPRRPEGNVPPVIE